MDKNQKEIIRCGRRMGKPALADAFLKFELFGDPMTGASRFERRKLEIIYPAITAQLNIKQLLIIGILRREGIGYSYEIYQKISKLWPNISITGIRDNVMFLKRKGLIKEASIQEQINVPKPPKGPPKKYIKLTLKGKRVLDMYLTLFDNILP